MLKKFLFDSWLFFKNHFLAISIIILPIVIPIEIFTTIYHYYVKGNELDFSAFAIPMIINIIAYPIYRVGVVFYIASIISSEKIDTKSLWKLGLKFWLPYTILSILVGLAVMLGLLLLVIPGIFFVIRYALAEFDLLLVRSNPLAAMRNSWNMTKEYVWVILGGYVIITVVLYVPYFLVVSFISEEGITYWVLWTLSNIVYSVLMILYAIFSFRVYEFYKFRNNQSLNNVAP